MPGSTVVRHLRRVPNRCILNAPRSTLLFGDVVSISACTRQTHRARRHPTLQPSLPLEAVGAQASVVLIQVLPSSGKLLELIKAQGAVPIAVDFVEDLLERLPASRGARASSLENMKVSAARARAVRRRVASSHLPR